MTELQFTSDGTWGGTELRIDGQPVIATELYIEIACGHSGPGVYRRGGVTNGGELAAYYRLSATPALTLPVFPGAIEIQVPGHCLRLEHPSPIPDLPSLDVFFDGQIVSNALVGILLQVDIDQEVLTGIIELLEPHTFSADALATISLI